MEEFSGYLLTDLTQIQSQPSSQWDKVEVHQY